MLVVDWQDLYRFDPEFVDDYRTKPEQPTEEALRLSGLPADVSSGEDTSVSGTALLKPYAFLGTLSLIHSQARSTSWNSKRAPPSLPSVIVTDQSCASAI